MVVIISEILLYWVVFTTILILINAFITYHLMSVIPKMEKQLKQLRAKDFEREL